MSLLKRQKTLQSESKKMSREDFIAQVTSWYPLVLYTNKGRVSKYPENDRFTNLMQMNSFAAERDNLPLLDTYDIKQPFFSNFYTLLQKVPLPLLIYFFENENCDYADACIGVKNVYLSFSVTKGSENVFYSLSVKTKCINIFNSFLIRDVCENIYQCVGIMRSSFVFHSRYILDSSYIWYSHGLLGCKHCLGCCDLQNQSYCIDNIQLTKDEYFKQRDSYLRDRLQTHELYPLSTSDFILGNNTSSGSFIINSNNIENGYFVNHLNTGRNCIMTGSGAGRGTAEQYNIFLGGGSDHFYTIMGAGRRCEHIYYSCNLISCVQVYYSYFLESCSYCLGCIGLKNKSFCIFNKQYSKEERHEKVDEMFTKMEQDGTLGKFFPGRMNPFYFNDTAAYLIDDSFTKEEVTAKGYLRRDEEVKVDIPEGVEVVKVNELDQYEGWKDETGNIISHAERSEVSLKYERDPSLHSGGQYIRRIDPSILEKVIQDEAGNVYRIVKMEYDFLMKHALPLPRLHWLERLKSSIKLHR